MTKSVGRGKLLIGLGYGEVLVGLSLLLNLLDPLFDLRCKHLDVEQTVAQVVVPEAFDSNSQKVCQSAIPRARDEIAHLATQSSFTLKRIIKPIKTGLGVP